MDTLFRNLYSARICDLHKRRKLIKELILSCSESSWQFIFLERTKKNYLSQIKKDFALKKQKKVLFWQKGVHRSKGLNSICYLLTSLCSLFHKKKTNFVADSISNS